MDRHLLDAFRSAVWRKHWDQRESVGLAGMNQVISFFGRQIGYDEPACTCCGSISSIPVESVSDQRIDITHQHERDFDAAVAKRFYRRDAIGNGSSIIQRYLRSMLYCRTIC